MKSGREKIVLLGGGGHARVLIELIRKTGAYEIIGILDPYLEKNSAIGDVPVLDGDDVLEDLLSEGIQNACIAVGSVRDNSKREQLYGKVKKAGFFVPSLIHPRAIVSDDLDISEGVQIMAGAVLQTGSFIGENTIINTGSIVEHDCTIGKHVHLCPRALLLGDCTVGDGVFIGAGSTVIQGIQLGEWSTMAAGSVVLHDVNERTMVKGVPAK